MSKEKALEALAHVIPYDLITYYRVKTTWEAMKIIAEIRKYAENANPRRFADKITYIELINAYFEDIEWEKIKAELE